MTPDVLRYVPSPPIMHCMRIRSLLTERDKEITIAYVLLIELQILLHDHVLAHEFQLLETEVCDRDVHVCCLLPIIQHSTA